MTAPSWPLAPVRCAAPEPVALCPVVHTLRCRRLIECVFVAWTAWRTALDAQPTCAPARGRCGR